MRVSDFDYDLPNELIARQPLENRADARMMHVRRTSDEIDDRSFREFPDLLRRDDLLVFNNTRVMPPGCLVTAAARGPERLSTENPAAREFLRGKVEVLLTRQTSTAANEWEALVHPGRKLGLGERVYFGAEASEGSHEIAAEIVGRGTFGERHLRFDPVDDFFAVLDRIGHIPLPPYIDRPDTAADREQYQTVYAKRLGSVAAPTAGLHFTPRILECIRQRGIETVEITLHVGLGTFQPVRAETVEEHRLHREWFQISDDAADRIQSAREAGRRIVAVGTTSVRTLEFAARQNTRGRIVAQRRADIFTHPGFDFRVVGAMLTNFHLPKSTLLMLVSALAGRERILRVYEYAVEQRYRFYSYGDCMFVE